MGCVIIINGDGGCRLWQPTGGLSPSRSAWSEGRRPLGAVLHSSNDLGELSHWLCHDDSTINILICISIIIINGVISNELSNLERLSSVFNNTASHGPLRQLSFFFVQMFIFFKFVTCHIYKLLVAVCKQSLYDLIVV